MGKSLSSGALAGRTDIKILPERRIPQINSKSSWTMTQGKQTWSGIWKGGVILSVLALLNEGRRGGARIAHSGQSTQHVQMPWVTQEVFERQRGGPGASLCSVSTGIGGRGGPPSVSLCHQRQTSGSHAFPLTSPKAPQTELTGSLWPVLLQHLFLPQSPYFSHHALDQHYRYPFLPPPDWSSLKADTASFVKIFPFNHRVVDTEGAQRILVALNQI